MTRDNQSQFLFPSCLVCSNHSQAPLRSRWRWPVSREACQKSAERRCLAHAPTGKELVVDEEWYRGPCTVTQPGPQGAASSPLLLCRAAKRKSAKPLHGPGQQHMWLFHQRQQHWKLCGTNRQMQVQPGKGHFFLALDLTLEQMHWPPPALMM